MLVYKRDLLYAGGMVHMRVSAEIYLSPPASSISQPECDENVNKQKFRPTFDINGRSLKKTSIIRMKSLLTISESESSKRTEYFHTTSKYSRS